MTNGEIDRLGKNIALSKGHISTNDLNALQEYRKTFQQPIANVFSYVLKEARKIDKQCIVTYRIKRIDTIIEKLQRFSDSEKGPMQLSRMGDIAGCRCIINSLSDDKTYQLLNAINAHYGQQCPCKINDYITKPRESGYRSIHVYVRDPLSGKSVEIQIRNKNQHNWATLVEIIDLLYGTKNKEGSSTGELGRFLLLYSQKGSLSRNQIMELLSIEGRKKIFENMSDTFTRNYLAVKSQWINQKSKGSYYVIEANKEKSIIESFISFNEAEKQYYEKYLNNKDSNIVLTHLYNPSFEQISMAYSNYVLSMHAFIDEYRHFVEMQIIDSIKNRSYWIFRKEFKIYFRNIKSHFKNMKQEASRIDSCAKYMNVNKSQVRKWGNDLVFRINLWQKETEGFVKSLASVSRDKDIFRWLIKKRLHKTQRIIQQS